MKRRSFILGALAAPAVITTPGLLMPVKAVEWSRPFPYVWYDTSDATTIIMDATGRITMLLDKSGNGRHLVADHDLGPILSQRTIISHRPLTQPEMKEAVSLLSGV